MTNTQDDKRRIQKNSNKQRHTENRVRFKREWLTEDSLWYVIKYVS